MTTTCARRGIGLLHMAVAPVLLVATGIAGLVFSTDALREEIVPQLDHLVGREVEPKRHMLFIVGLVTALIAIVSIRRMRVSGGVNSANLGWMSEQWLAEHRASPAL